MTKKEYCLMHQTVAYISELGGFEIKGVEYDIDDYIYAVSNAWYGTKSYHKLRIKYDNDGCPYVVCYGYRLYLSDAIRTNI